MTTQNTGSLFDRIHAAHGIVKLVVERLDAVGDAELAHVAGALGPAVELLDRLADEAMTGSTLTKPRRTARAVR